MFDSLEMVHSQDGWLVYVENTDATDNETDDDSDEPGGHDIDGVEDNDDTSHEHGGRETEGAEPVENWWGDN